MKQFRIYVLFKIYICTNTWNLIITSLTKRQIRLCKMFGLITTVEHTDEV